MDPTELLERGFDHSQRIVDGVGPDQMGASTPCSEWDVRALLNHMTAAVVMFGNAITGAGGPPEGDLVGDDPGTAFRQAAKTTLDAWRQPGVLDRTVPLPFGEMPGAVAANINFMDAFVHGLDLAVATGQEDKVDQSLAETALTRARESGIDNFRVPGVFGPEAPCEDSAAAHRRLLAFLGREV